MRRSSILFLAPFTIAIAACGDDTSTDGSGGGSTSSTTSTSSTSSSQSSSSTTSSQGGNTSDGGGGSTSDGGGGSGDGGSGGQGGAGDGGAGGAGGGGLGGNPSYTELCEYQNEQYQTYSESLECPVTPGVCEEPSVCAEELMAVRQCLYEFLSFDDCECQGEAEDTMLWCRPEECVDEVDAYFVCFDAL